MTINLIPVTQAIAANLGDGWSAEVPPFLVEDGKTPTDADRMYLHGPEGMSVFLVAGRRFGSENKVEAHAKYPEQERHHERRTTPFVIKFSESKTAQQMANDIKRRLIDGTDYQAELREVFAHMERVAKARVQREATVVLLTQAHPNLTVGREGPDQTRLHWSDNGVNTLWGDLTVAGKGDVTMELHNVDPRDVVAMLDALKAVR